MQPNLGFGDWSEEFSLGFRVETLGDFTGDLKGL